MPEGIQSLPRLSGGLAVPHITSWSSEGTETLRADPLLDAVGWAGVAFFASGALGQGAPTFGEINAARQRRAMLRFRCQICDVALGGPPRENFPLWLVDLRAPDPPGKQVALDGRGPIVDIAGATGPVIYEPWVCEPCLEYSLLVCPSLIRQRHAQRAPLRLLLVRSWNPVPRTRRVSDELRSRHDASACDLVLAHVTVADSVAPENFLSQKVMAPLPRVSGTALSMRACPTAHENEGTP